MLLVVLAFIVSIHEILYLPARVGNASVLFLLTMINPLCCLLIRVYDTSDFQSLLFFFLGGSLFLYAESA